MAIIHLTPELAHEEYQAKQLLLEASGDWIAPMDFYSEVFHTQDLSRPTMMVEAGNTFRVCSLDEILDTAVYEGRQNWYISMADYFQDYLKQEFLNTLYAFVLDLDFMRPKCVELVLDGLHRHLYPLPTYIVNSGTGLHIYYVLEQSLDMYRSERTQAKSLLSRMNKQYEKVFFNTGVAQPHWVGQPYRVVGSKTKVDDIVTAYKVGDEWAIDQLAGAFRKEWRHRVSRKVKQPPTEKMVKLAEKLAKENGSEICDLSDFKETYNFISAELKKTPKNRKFEQKNDNGFKTPSLQWYERTCLNIRKMTQEGHRYSSLMAMAVIAVKCGIPFKRLEEDAWKQAYIWHEDVRKYATVFNLKNVPSALRMYDEKYRKVTKEQLEEWLGWSFHSSVKRNGQSQKDHLEEARMLRDLRMKRQGKKWTDGNGPKPKKGQVKAYLKAHPDANKSKIARETGLSRTTVIKWYDIAVNELRQEDEKTL